MEWGAHPSRTGSPQGKVVVGFPLTEERRRAAHPSLALPVSGDLLGGSSRIESAERRQQGRRGHTDPTPQQLLMYSS